MDDDIFLAPNEERIKKEVERLRKEHLKLNIKEILPTTLGLTSKTYLTKKLR